VGNCSHRSAISDVSMSSRLMRVDDSMLSSRALILGRRTLQQILPFGVCVDFQRK